MLKVLEDEGIPIDLLTGVSMGGIIAAAYASGLTPEFLEQEALRMATPRNLLGLVDLSIPRSGFLEGQKVITYLRNHIGDRSFEELRIPLTLLAVDLNDGREVYLNQGSVLEAVRASIALPGVFTPIERGEQLLVDGGLLDNLPADVARSMGADVVIAVDVMAGEGVSFVLHALEKRRYVPGGLASTIEVLSRSLEVMMTALNRYRLSEAKPEVIIRPPVPGNVTVLTGFTRAAEVIAIGEKAAREALPRIRAEC